MATPPPQQLARARLVVLDTSHLARLAHDSASPSRDHRRAADGFVRFLQTAGWLPLLSWHQLEELLQHGDEQTVDRRVHFLRSLPLIAWVGASSPQAGLGTVFDVLTAEVAAAFAEPGTGAAAVRDRAKDRLLRFGSGGEAIPVEFLDWRELRPALAQRQGRAMEVVAISRTELTNIDDTRLADWLKMPLREPEDARAQFARLREQMTDEIARRGDRRIPDPGAVADTFYEEVEQQGPMLYAPNTEHPALTSLRAAGLESDDLDPQAKLGQLLELVIFRRKLRLASDALGMPWPEVRKSVTAERLPVIVIENSMRAYAQDNPERKGSELTDVHLLCLASYADLTYVDKRTMENVMRARRKVPQLASLMGAVAKASSYREIEAQLSAM
jgi:hypothetical protein